jgi:UDP-N-acetylglucosamine acyltransferase
MSGVEKDVIPYAMVMGERAHVNGLNLVGLRRRGFSNQTIQELMKTYETLFDASSGDTFMERIERLAQNASNDEAVQKVIEFIQEDSKRRLCTPKN